MSPSRWTTALSGASPNPSQSLRQATTLSSNDCFSIICLSQSAWDADLPTNRQQVMRRAAARGHQVLFVETAPFMGRSIVDVLRRRSPPSRTLEALRAVDRGAGVSTVSAMNLLPWGHRRQVPNRVNNWLTSLNLRRLRRRLPDPVVLWLYDPCTSTMIGSCGEDIAVYDCVDDYPRLAFYDEQQKALADRGDHEAATFAKVVFTTTTPLYERHLRLNPDTHLVGNVGDFDHFQGAVDRETAAAEIRDLPQPVLGFAGRFMTGKIDFSLLEASAARHPEWTVLLIGPADQEARRHLERLAQRENVHWLGHRPYDILPQYVAGFDVGLCPYNWNDWMRGGFPLKLYEYLAAGKPIVASGNPDLAGMEPDVLLVRGADAFVQAVEQALEHRTAADVERRRALARKHTWESRATTLLELTRDRLRPAQR